MSSDDHFSDPATSQPSTPAPPRPKASKCPCCGHHTLRLTAKAHRVCRYRLVVLTLPVRLLVPTCSRCKHTLLSFDAVPELAATLEAEYRAELSRRVAAKITLLNRLYPLRHLEVHLDLSQGYLSRLRTGDGIPSAALVSLLALLAAEPSRLEELKGYWALPLETQPSPPSRGRAS